MQPWKYSLLPVSKWNADSWQTCGGVLSGINKSVGVFCRFSIYVASLNMTYMLNIDNIMNFLG